MSAETAGPLRPYQVTWRSGHIETVMGHQVLVPIESSPIFDGAAEKPRIIKIHGYVDGEWTLVLFADAADILTIRLLTSEERPA